MKAKHPGRVADQNGGGEVILAGAGPGDPELITVKALNAIRQAQVLVYDRLVNPQLVCEAPSDCELVYVGKRKHLHVMRQADINRLLVDRASAGLRVVRLKGGDPFIFGRGGEELEALLAHNIPTRVIPGITAASGAASTLGLPLTHRDTNQAVTFVTAHRRNNTCTLDWDLVLRPNQTVAIYMGLSNLKFVVNTLLERGCPPDRQFTVVGGATTDHEIAVSASIADVLTQPELAHIKSPALLICHDYPALLVNQGAQGERELEPAQAVMPRA